MDERAVAAVVTMLAAAVCAIGAGRAFGLDASVTVHRFVATGSLLDPFRRQVVFNNHVLFSFADHLVYTATGSRREAVLRIVPIGAVALSAGLVAWSLAQRFGAGPAFAAAAVLVANPIVLGDGREVRGYSMLLLTAVAATLLLAPLRAGRSRPSAELLYVASLAAGVATHLYGLAVIAVHAAIVAPPRRTLPRWLARWAAAAALGCCAYIGVAQVMLGSHRGRAFQPAFPLDVGRALLGGSAVTVALLAAPVVIGAVSLRDRAWVARGCGMALVVLLAAWVLAPRDLYPRFFIWALPAVACAVAVAVRRVPALALLVAAFVVVQAVRLGPTLTRDPSASRSAAAIALRASRTGRTVCAFPLSAYAMEAYDPGVTVIGLSPQPPPCDLVLQLTPDGDPRGFALPPAWQPQLPYRRTLPAATPGLVFARRRSSLAR